MSDDKQTDAKRIGIEINNSVGEIAFTLGGQTLTFSCRPGTGHPTPGSHVRLVTEDL